MAKRSKVAVTSVGKCSLCNGTFSKDAMTKHLAACLQTAIPKGRSGKKEPRKAKMFHILAEGRYQPEYWLHLEVPATATLTHLDQFLRQIWLECCGHMSAFSIGKRRFLPSSPFGELEEGGGLDLFGEELGEENMNVKLGDVLARGTKFSHEYDFGTPTDLALKVVAEREGESMGKAVRLLARNDPPKIPCQSCGEPAEVVCSECIYDAEAWFCRKCARKHKCDEEMFLPVVNSPRTGQCGYTG